MVEEETSEPVDREQERRRIAELLSAHAPPDWEERFEREQLLDAIIDTTPLQMFVMAADIRESTLLMKEAVQFERFAKIMDKFVSAVRSGIGTPGGWFDKFTGDGFLAYWIAPATPKEQYQRRFVEAAGNLAHTAHELIELFHRRVLEDFRRNSRNLSDGVGLSIGLDAGPGFLVEIAGELTLVGPPVVGRRADGERRVAAAGDLRERLSRRAPPRRAGRDLRGPRDDGHAGEPADEGVPEGPGGLRADVPGRGASVELDITEP